jgi:hypothetical protein
MIMFFVMISVICAVIAILGIVEAYKDEEI